MSIEENSRRVCKVYSSPYFFIPFPACKTNAMNLPPGGGIPEERERGGGGEARRSSRPEKTPWPLRARLKVSFVSTQSRTPSHVFWRRPQKGSQKSNECTDPQSCTCICGGPFVRLAMCATLVYLACGLVQLVFDLASSLSISLSFFSPPPSFPSSTCRSSFLRPPREHSKNWRRLLSSPLLFLPLSSRDAATNNALPRWSAAI